MPNNVLIQCKPSLVGICINCGKSSHVLLNISKDGVYIKMFLCKKHIDAFNEELTRLVQQRAQNN